MKQNIPPADPENHRPQPDVPQPDGPLTQLLDKQASEREPESDENTIPSQPRATHTGRDDYASGTSEHLDDREV
jgi:hypothetical protein